MSGETNTGAVIVGCFMFVAGAGLALLGGSCSVMLLASLLNAPSMSGTGDWTPLLVVALAMLAGGVALAWFGIKLMSGGTTGAPPPP